jgi:polyhydroxyalkanoate synthesis regulator phasin
MSKPDASPDPFDPLRKLVDDWEKRIDGVANKVMGTDGFSQAMNQTQTLSLRVQQGFQDAMGAHLKNINMPSRGDVLRLAESVQALNQRMARMENMLEQVLHNTGSAGTAGRSGPPRTRKPPSQRSGEPT